MNNLPSGQAAEAKSSKAGARRDERHENQPPTIPWQEPFGASARGGAGHLVDQTPSATIIARTPGPRAVFVGQKPSGAGATGGAGHLGDQNPSVTIIARTPGPEAVFAGQEPSGAGARGGARHLGDQNPSATIIARTPGPEAVFAGQEPSGAGVRGGAPRRCRHLGDRNPSATIIARDSGPGTDGRRRCKTSVIEPVGCILYLGTRGRGCFCEAEPPAGAGGGAGHLGDQNPSATIIARTPGPGRGLFSQGKNHPE
ncbi:hypothetical protein Pint_12085 [Pistacia integerrima]|uniref:Uncharacterized protein n=1 Tax=Pistacia integerrima TaxID=434235 RepID=A0ACC0XIG3_9ROSI|nr:hypothetical protein Pint_12085 [Pistacia integerrima]